jgi:DNA-binding response OmpR family regulator
VSKKIVLIVDDEPLSVRVLQHHLENDYTVKLAHSGREALQIISHTRPDVILLDLLMPDMDGYEVYSAIRRLPALDGVPVLFVTSLPDAECEAAGLEMGAEDYIHKPFVADLVRLRIKNHLALSQERVLLLKRSQELLELNAKLEEEVSQRRYTQSVNEELIKKLEDALEQVKQLEGIISICSYCHKIRDDQNVWQRLEEYISEHTEAMFSHGICPHCAEEQMVLYKKSRTPAD